MGSGAAIRVSFKIDRPRGTRLEQPISTADDAMYTLRYRYERRGAEWWAVLESAQEVMPPITPQANPLNDNSRLPMMDRYGFSATLEAEQRRKEWAEINE